MKWEKTYGLFVILILLFVTQEVYSENEDSQHSDKIITDTIAVFKKAHLSLHLSTRENNEASLIAAFLDLVKFHEDYGQLDSAIFYLQELKLIYKNAGNIEAVAASCLGLKDLYNSKAAYDKCLKQIYEALEIYEEINNLQGVAICYTHICDLLYYEYKYQESTEYCDKAIAIQKQIDNKIDLALSYRYKASSQLFIEGALEDALKTINKAIDVYHEIGETGAPLFASLNGRGNILKYMGRYEEAIADYQYIYEECLELGLNHYLIPPIANIGHVYVMQEKWEKALPYNLKAIELMKESGNTKNLWENYMHVSDIYSALGDYKNAYDYNILYSDEYAKYLNTIIERLESEALIKYETAKKDETINVQENKIANQRNIQILYAIIAVLLIISLIGMMQSRKNIRKKQRLIESSKEELQQSLESLKATQAQLIHSEKMASLGELTAGIAHEIQNPVNFVNNFSEVNSELLTELKEEIEKGDKNEIQAILDDLTENEGKINHHGKRADGIVKGMLQHSRSNTGLKEPTDINVLADEYLRLAYHGLRAKDKTFNADFELQLDESLPKIKIISQEIGRVLLNLINNAFYAVDEKQKQQPENYKPMVTVKTIKKGDHIEINVRDNGNGIPGKIKDKIFQPFFTTKPTGEGTGLGLSMSYDIITKGHGGDLDLQTQEGKGTEFIIHLNI